jgi:hypothetical protein
MHRQVGYGGGLDELLDDIPLAHRPQAVQQGAGRQRQPGRPLILFAGQFAAGLVQEQVFKAATQHLGQVPGALRRDAAHLAVDPAQHGAAVHAQLLGQPPLAQAQFGHAVAQGGGVEQQ